MTFTKLTNQRVQQQPQEELFAVCMTTAETALFHITVTFHWTWNARNEHLLRTQNTNQWEKFFFCIFGEGILVVKHNTRAKIGPHRVSWNLTVIHCNILHISNGSSSHTFYKPLWNRAVSNEKLCRHTKIHGIAQWIWNEISVNSTQPDLSYMAMWTQTGRNRSAKATSQLYSK